MSQITITELPEALQQLLQEAEKTDTPLTITKEGRPFAIVYPATKLETRPAPGFRKDSGKILGDIVSPIEQPWEVLQ